MARKSIQYEMKQNALPGIVNNNTYRTYNRAIKSFALWCRESEGLRTVDAIRNKGTVDVVQQYTNTLIEKGNSPATIHTKIAGICKGLCISMKEIKKPLRSADAINRGRDPTANKQGKADLNNPKYARLVTLQTCVGIRRAELSRLRGGDLCKDESGYICVHVVRGKGGKEQYQRILPDDIDTVRSVMARVPDNQLIFTSKEMNNKIPLHTLRAEHAKKVYQYYAKRIDSDPRYADQLRKELITRWDAAHPDNNHGREQFLRVINNPKPYKLRGANKTTAIKNGRPIEYSRLAVISTSVFSLAHWRLGVSIINYLTTPDVL